jgi:hypothetical protein
MMWQNTKAVSLGLLGAMAVLCLTAMGRAQTAPPGKPVVVAQ